MMKLNDGFYTALGSPLDKDGNCIRSSLETHIHQQIEAGASGLLLMGSMGIEASIKNSAYLELVDTANCIVGGKLPLFIGAMDNSIAKVREKVDLMKGAQLAGVVLTTPFYSFSTEDELVTWFTSIADFSPFPVYLYDLPVVTKVKITLPLIRRVSSHPNIRGIKTADLQMILAMMRDPELSERFNILYSGLDLFDYANRLGIRRNLDGMFCCTPRNARAMFDAVRAGNFSVARQKLDNILLLRDTMVQNTLFPSFTHAMNLLGCSGNFSPDYAGMLDDSRKETIRRVMTEIGEL